MVSNLLSSWSSGNLSEKSEDKTSSGAGSTFDKSNSTVKPLVITNKHINLPPLLHSNENEDIFDKITGMANLSKKNGDDDSEEIFSNHLKRNIMHDLINRDIVDKVFEKFDDPYAKFPVTKTPKSFSSVRTPKSKVFNTPKTPTTSTWKYVTLEEREAKRKAEIEVQQDFCRVLEKNGIDTKDYVSSVFSSTKKSKFECSTPINNKVLGCSTPLRNRSNENTPISGIKQMPYFQDRYVDSPNYSPLSFTPRHSNISFSQTLTPVQDLPPEIKSTLLSGIVCYVDTRRDNEDVTESVQAELLTLGAKIEKNFTKKVTHVVFKEGRVSTYLKAKKEEVPLVSVLWIEACKRVRGIADPAQHRPKRMEKYDNLLPFETLKKRRMKFFNPTSKIRKNILEHYHNPKFVPTLNGKKLIENIKAATVCKDIDVDENKENKGIKKYCSKKLFSEKCENLFPSDDKYPPEMNAPLQNDIPPEKLSKESSSDSIPNVECAVLKRKSAPAQLYINKKGKKRKATEPAVVEIIDLTASSMNESNHILGTNKTSETNNVDEKDNAGSKDVFDQSEEIKIQQNLNKLEEKECKKSNKVLERSDINVENVVKTKRRRKLYDPTKVYVSFDEGESTNETTSVQSVKKARTRATSSRQLVKLAMARKRENKRIVTDPDCNESLASTFVSDTTLDKSNKAIVRKEDRSIVFTSVHRNDLPKYLKKVSKLGRFEVEDEVTKKTTHVVCNGPRRTLNLIKGIARGCWIVDMKWLEESEVNEKWLPEDDYILSEDYPCITECCRERRGLKTSKVINIFKDAGSIFVSKGANPLKRDLDQLLKICGATVSKSCSNAHIKIGGSRPHTNSSGLWISEKWIIDSISKNKLQHFEKYNLKPHNTDDTQNSEL